MSTRMFARLFPILVVLLVSSSAQALTVEYGGTENPSLKGATGSLSIEGPLAAGTGEFDVVWSMDFTGYEGSPGDHPYLTHIAFKAFGNVSAVSLDGISWTGGPVDGLLAFPSNVNNGGCASSSPASMVCVTLDANTVDATLGGSITAEFTVTGDLLSEWAYRGKFGPQNGWVISESGSASSPVPEPTAAMVFGAGLIAAGFGIRRTPR